MFRHNTALDPKVGTEELRVGRRDIWFHSVSVNEVRIAITVHNDGPWFSAPTTMELEAAPLGAFLPWTPLGGVDVPPIAPGKALIIETMAKRRFSGFSDWRPSTSRDWMEPDDSPGYDRVSRTLPGDPVLPESPIVSMGPEMFWVGNVNVFIGETSVECHRAEPLPILPGRMNRAIFLVGQGPGAYMFQFGDIPRDWRAHIYVRDQERHNEFIAPPIDTIRPGEWWEILHGGIVYLDLDVPRGYSSGGVTVEVTQRSTNKTAVVEFGFA